MTDLSVLVVEDDPVFALELKSVLSGFGFKTIKFVKNSGNALEQILAWGPDLILMDISIDGELNGIEVAAAIRDRMIPLVFMTGHQDMAHYEQVRALGIVCGYVVKPIYKPSFLNTIELILKWHQMEQVEADSSDELKIEPYENVMLLKQGNILHRIAMEELDYFQSDGNYSYIQTADKKFALKISLKKLLNALPREQFVQVQQRYIVAVRQISHIDLGASQVYLRGDYAALPLGRKYRDQLLGRFSILK